VNTIIDKIVTNTYGSCDKKTYVTAISNFYLGNLDYSSYRHVMTTTHYDEFTKYIDAILRKNIDIMYNLRSIKLYDNDIAHSSYRAGVFKTDNFIIKIDTESFNFKNEIVGMYNIGKGLIEEYSIVLPYYTYFSSKSKKNISFSVQPRIHNTISLRDWMLIYANQLVNIEVYIQMCIRICKSIEFINSKHLVHGDIKPDNIIIEYTTNRAYIIDFGLCGLHELSEGTGGTKPFCHPDTMNTDENYKDSSEYNWVKNAKNNDLWSISFIFATILIFRKCYVYYKDYPANFFNSNKYININYLNYIPDKFRAPFVYVLTKGETNVSIDIQSFISLLEKAL
jgi:serine/threonine protein kinase